MIRRASVFLLGALLHAFPSAPAGAAGAASPAADSRTGRSIDRLAFERMDAALREPRMALARRAPAEWRMPLTGQDGFDVLDYHLALAIDPAAETLGGAVTVRGRSLIGGLEQVPLDLWEGMTVSAVEGAAGGLAWTRGRYTLTVTLDHPRGPGEEFEFTVLYAGMPAAAGWGSFVFLTHGPGGSGGPAVATVSEPWYARTWWPCKDIPADKATVTMSVTVPDPLVVASNGLLQSRGSNGDGTTTWTWREGYPIATYLVSLAAADYVEQSSSYSSPAGATFPITNYAYPEDDSAAAADFSVAPAQLDLEIGHFGEYPFAAEKYGIVEFPLYVAMEHQTMTSMPWFTVTGTHTYDLVLAHELAHHWFGDMVSPADWREIWLNEGFARYAEVLWQEHLGGPGAGADYMRLLDPASGDFVDTVYDPAEIFGSTVYNKGAWVLHMLRHVMGDARFFEALRAYLAAHAYGNATSADFQAACEATHGSPLGWFFGAWLHQRYRPHYHIWWRNVEEPGGFQLDLHVEQVQEGTGLFTMPLDVRVTRASGDTTITIWNHEASQDYAWHLPERTTALALDPEDYVLKEVAVVTAPGATGIGLPGAAGGLALAPPSPNPWRDAVTLTFELAHSADVMISIYDARGRRVFASAPVPMDAGAHAWTWDGRAADGAAAPVGVYRAEVRAGSLRAGRLVVRLR